MHMLYETTSFVFGPNASKSAVRTTALLEQTVMTLWRTLLSLSCWNPCPHAWIHDGRRHGRVRSSGTPPPKGSGQQSFDSEDELDKDLTLEWERKVICWLKKGKHFTSEYLISCSPSTSHIRLSRIKLRRMHLTLNWFGKLGRWWTVFMKPDSSASITPHEQSFTPRTLREFSHSSEQA